MLYQIPAQTFCINNKLSTSPAWEIIPLFWELHWHRGSVCPSYSLTGIKKLLTWFRLCEMSIKTRDACKHSHTQNQRQQETRTNAHIHTYQEGWKWLCIHTLDTSLQHCFLAALLEKKKKKKKCDGDWPCFFSLVRLAAAVETCASLFLSPSLILSLSLSLSLYPPYLPLNPGRLAGPGWDEAEGRARTETNKRHCGNKLECNSTKRSLQQQVLTTGLHQQGAT